jgi:hypothetical protein
VYKDRPWISTTLGVLLAFAGMLTIFFVASLEGFKEIKASSGESAKLLALWRDQNDSLDGFPEEQSDTIIYKNNEYYFIVESHDPFKWYFAYDSSVNYIFKDVKFYVLTGLTIAISLYVSHFNYISTVRRTTDGENFSKTLSYYQRKKEQIEKYTQYVPAFCSYKTKQAYDLKVREILEMAMIDYGLYMKGEIDYNNLGDWQKRALKSIEKVKVDRLYASDLLQEGGNIKKKISLLPMSQEKHHKNYMINGFFQKVITSFLSGLVVSFGIVLGNWFLGLTYGMTVFISYVSAVIIASDYANTTLRYRFVAKGDLLNEFYNIKEQFIGGEENGRIHIQPDHGTGREGESIQ